MEPSTKALTGKLRVEAGALGNPSPWEMETGKPGLQSHLQRHSKFKASMEHTRPDLEKAKQNKKRVLQV